MIHNTQHHLELPNPPRTFNFFAAAAAGDPILASLRNAAAAVNLALDEIIARACSFASTERPTDHAAGESENLSLPSKKRVRHRARSGRTAEARQRRPSERRVRVGLGGVKVRADN